MSQQWLWLINQIHTKITTTMFYSLVWSINQSMVWLSLSLYPVCMQKTTNSKSYRRRLPSSSHTKYDENPERSWTCPYALLVLATSQILTDSQTELDHLNVLSRSECSYRKLSQISHKGNAKLCGLSNDSQYYFKFFKAILIESSGSMLEKKRMSVFSVHGH